MTTPRPRRPKPPSPGERINRFMHWDGEDPPERIILDCPYNKRFITELKELVEPSDRTYAAETRTWKIDGAYLAPLTALVRRNFGSTLAFDDGFSRSDPVAASSLARAASYARPARPLPKPPADPAAQVRLFSEQAATIANLELKVKGLEEQAVRLKQRRNELENIVARLHSEINQLRLNGMRSTFDDLMRGARSAAPAGANDPYAVLGLTRNAEPEVVASAYRTLALKWHPDKGGSHEKMTRLNQAYDAIKAGGR